MYISERWEIPGDVREKCLIAESRDELYTLLLSARIV